MRNSPVFVVFQVASVDHWLLFTKTLAEIQIQEILEAEPSRLDRLCTFSAEVLERVDKESSDARMVNVDYNTGPDFILVCSHFFTTNILRLF